MTDHQGLTDEQLETLRSLPCDSLPTAEVSRLFDLGVATGVAHVPGKGQPPGVYWRARRTETGDALLATLDHHTEQAVQDERRRIDGLAASLFSFYYDPSFELNLRAVYDPHPDRPNGATEFFPSDNGFVAALEAATRAEAESEATHDARSEAVNKPNLTATPIKENKTDDK